MELTYQNMIEFMENYCKDYSQWCNDPTSISKLDQYWAPDFVSTAYMHIEGMPYPFVLSSRKEFKDFILKGHVEISETLIPVETIIDERRNKAVMLIKIKKREKKTGNVFVSDAMAMYGITLNEQKEIRIKSLQIFTDDAVRKLTQWVKE